MRVTKKLLFPVALALLTAGCGEERKPKAEPRGDETSTRTNILKGGARALQHNAPLNEMYIYLVGFHPMKDEPSEQMEAHHYCRQVNEDFAQCALFDGNTEEANLTGVEYIISEKLFDTLPTNEKQYWHPHNGEILSGQLVAPGLPEAAEKELMRSKMNSYGKTWHFWMTDAGQTVPLGEPMLAWSFNREGEAKPGLVETRDQELKIDSKQLSKRRQELRSLARPQQGVDLLRHTFGRQTTDIPGVTERKP